MVATQREEVPGEDAEEHHEWDRPGEDALNYE
jgi:hypothetical protein